MDLISVIIPVYNVERFLKKCIDSVLKQTYENIEIILIDDGSNDNSGRICDDYARKYERIKVIHKNNEGLGMARNDGINVASGKYIMFLDSDDTIDTILINTLQESILDSQFDIVIGGYNRIDENDNITYKFRYGESEYFGEKVKKEFLPRLIGSAPHEHDSLAVSSCGVLYKKAVIDKFNILFKSERKVLSEDLIFNLDFISKIKSVKIIDESLYNYRLVEGSLTKRYLKNRFILSKKLFEIEKDYLLNESIFELVEQRLIKQFFLNLRMCFRQEDCSISNKKLKEALYNIKSICNDEFVLKCIEKYPVNELAYKQRIFIYMVKYRCKTLLYAFVKLGAIK